MDILRGMFEAVGMGEMEEAIYTTLLEQPGMSRAELLGNGTWTRRQVEKSLASLRANGLITQAPGKRVRFFPVPPDEAILPLIGERMEQMERARRNAVELGQRYHHALRSDRPADLVEVIADRETLGYRFLQMGQAAQSEIAVLDRPPYTSDPRNAPLLDIMARGIRVRTIYSAASFEVPGYLEWTRRLVVAGEQARVLPEVPAKLAIIDRRVGVIPLGFAGQEITGGIVIHGSSLLEMLIFFFEDLWARARPLDGGEEETPGDARAAPSDTNDVLTLLSTGLKDESIARALAISRSTVQRRVQQVMEALDARTRFHAGMLAAQNGWTSGPSALVREAWVDPN